MKFFTKSPVRELAQIERITEGCSGEEARNRHRLLRKISRLIRAVKKKEEADASPLRGLLRVPWMNNAGASPRVSSRAV